MQSNIQFFIYKIGYKNVIFTEHKVRDMWSICIVMENWIPEVGQVLNSCIRGHPVPSKGIAADAKFSKNLSVPIMVPEI
jgi:hypothetical protein